MAKRPGIKLRYYQENAIEATLNSIKKNDASSFLINMATGTGKTVVFSDIIDKYIIEGKRVLVLVNSEPILDQNLKTLRENFDIPENKIGIEHGDMSDFMNNVDSGILSPVIYTTVQTLTCEKGSKRRLEKLNPEDFDLIILDEAHHIRTPTCQKILKKLNGVKLIGLTATPDLADGTSIKRDYFGGREYRYSLRKGIEEKYLSRIQVKNIRINSIADNFEKKSDKADYSKEKAEKQILKSEIINDFTDAIVKNAIGKKTMVFCPELTSAKKVAIILKEKFPEAEIFYVGSDKNKKENETIIKQFKAAGSNSIMVNATMLAEGFNCPGVDNIVNLRLTTSEVLYRQIIGRGTRLADGKDNVTILNLFADLPGIIQPEQLFKEEIPEKEEKILEKLTRELNDKYEITDLLEARKYAERMYELGKKMGLKDSVYESNLRTISDEIVKADIKNSKLNNPAFKNVFDFDLHKESICDTPSEEMQEKLKKFGFPENSFQTNILAKKALRTANFMMQGTLMKEPDIAAIIDRDGDIKIANERVNSKRLDLINAISNSDNIFTCPDGEVNRDLVKTIMDYKVTTISGMECTNLPQKDYMDICEIPSNLFSTREQANIVLHAINEQLKNEKMPTLKDCLNYKCLNDLLYCNGEDLMEVTRMHKEYVRNLSKENSFSLADSVLNYYFVNKNYNNMNELKNELIAVSDPECRLFEKDNTLYWNFDGDLTTLGKINPNNIRDSIRNIVKNPDYKNIAIGLRKESELLLNEANATKQYIKDKHNKEVQKSQKESIHNYRRGLKMR